MPGAAASFPLAEGVDIAGRDLPVVAGPCVIEGDDWLLEVATRLAELSSRLELPLIFKSSYDKANRSSLKSFRGPGLEGGLAALKRVHEVTGLPVLTDVHEAAHCAAAADVCDVIQIPAFLCRQTDLVVAAAQTGRPVLVKKGQFMAPEEMRRVVDKARSTGNDRIGVTERGTSFGYNNLVVDMRSFTLLHEDGIPVLYDVTHSLQLPGAREEESGGDRRFAGPLTRAALAAGANGLYLETHPAPDQAKCDRETQLPLEHFESLVTSARRIYRSQLDPPGDEGNAA